MQSAERGARRRWCVRRFARLLAALVLGTLLANGPARAGETPTGGRAEPAPVLVEITSTVEPAPSEVSLVEVGEDGRAQIVDWLPEMVRFAEGSARLRLSPPDSAFHRIQIRAPGVWSAPIRLGQLSRRLGGCADRAPDEEPEALRRLVLWPATELAAEIVLPRARDKLPEAQNTAATVDLRLSPEPGSEGTRAGQPSGVVEVTCPVENGRLAGCTVPAGRWNLRLTREPYAPYFAWSLEIAAGQPADLGRVRLRQGGSVFGRMTTETGPVDPERARVAIRPLTANESPEPAERSRFRQLGRTLAPRPDGSFEIVGVPAGEYEVFASQPGFVIAHRAPVTVRRGQWTEIPEPLVLELPLHLTVDIEPAKAPAGDPWRLNLYRLDEDGEMLSNVSGTADDGGLWESPPTPAGAYRLEVRDGQDNSVRWQDVELTQESQVARVEIPLVAVEGEVTFGDEPLEATVWFGGRNGEERVKVRSGEQGELFAVLPHDGAWTVDVQAEEPRVRSRGLEIEIERRDDGEPSEVRIEVPSTRISGRVVEEDGRPPKERATVYLLRVGNVQGSDSWQADPNGQFEIRGARPGTYMVHAKSDGASSNVERVDVTEGLEPLVTLQISEKVHLTGRVVSADGPIPGAEVAVLPIDQSDGVPRLAGRSARTSVEGRFDVTIPAGTETVRITVAVPGYTVAIFRTSDFDDLEIVLGHEAGTLRIEELRGLFVPGEDLRVGLILADGEPLGLNEVRPWAEESASEPLSERTELTLSRMPPGTYTLCALTYQEALLVMSGAAYPSGDACTQGFLPSGGELTLQAP